MINETSKEEWSKVRSKIETKFDKLSGSQIDSLEGHMDQLTSTVKKAYSYDEDKAVQECNAFNESLKQM
jgi:uncharacterized protein YjbJ (UPF0337 family)